MVVCVSLSPGKCVVCVHIFVRARTHEWMNECAIGTWRMMKRTKVALSSGVAPGMRRSVISMFCVRRASIRDVCCTGIAAGSVAAVPVRHLPDRDGESAPRRGRQFALASGDSTGDLSSRSSKSLCRSSCQSAGGAWLQSVGSSRCGGTICQWRPRSRPTVRCGAGDHGSAALPAAGRCVDGGGGAAPAAPWAGGGSGGGGSGGGGGGLAKEFALVCLIVFGSLLWFDEALVVFL